MLYNKHVPIEQSALLVIDAQDSFKATPRWELRNNRDFEANVARLIAAYRAAGLPVIYFLHTDDDPGFETTSKHFKLMDFIDPKPDEPVLHKHTRNVFTSTRLAELLLEKGVRRLAITGIKMEQCCETSARVAADLGYSVDFVIDGTMTSPIQNRDQPSQELGVDAIRERTEYVLRGRFATITNTAAWRNNSRPYVHLHAHLDNPRLSRIAYLESIAGNSAVTERSVSIKARLCSKRNTPFQPISRASTWK